ncbi:trypco2 family protein [Actinoplanes sp. HUAS TT8]|uniref:trypco2 family protein n=1 Tax=Actinoplanes sp. HUAS TT8 TaxID=3447453 RepID=UPI003F525512
MNAERHDGIAFVEIIAAIKKAVKKANLSAADLPRDLKITEVTVSTTAMARQTLGGGVELTVPFVGLKLGGNLERSWRSAQRVEITLVPPAPDEEIEVRGGNVEKALVEAISTVRAALSAAAGGEDPFVLKSSTVVLDFVVTDSGTIKIVGAGEAGDEETQTVTLKLGPAVSV